jgi:hypothetical protein
MDVLVSHRIAPRLRVGGTARRILMAALIAIGGCASMGTDQIGPDRLEYGQVSAQC